MFPKGGMNNMMKQFGNMQKKMQKMQDELGNMIVEGTAGGGMVTVKATGKQEIVSVKIDPQILSDDVEMVEDMIVGAVNHALTKAQELNAEKMGGIMPNLPGGLKIPGL